MGERGKEKMSKNGTRQVEYEYLRDRYQVFLCPWYLVQSLAHKGS